ncbi:hypothetical protein [Streptomyces antimycoticus]
MITAPTRLGPDGSPPLRLNGRGGSVTGRHIRRFTRSRTTTAPAQPLTRSSAWRSSLLYRGGAGNFVNQPCHPGDGGEPRTEHVLQAGQGLDLDFLVGSSGHEVPRESH